MKKNWDEIYQPVTWTRSVVNRETTNYIGDAFSLEAEKIFE